MIRNCFGDAAELAVAALLHPERFEGPICYPAGAEELSHHDIAAVLTEELGGRVRFEPVSAHEWRRELVELFATDQVVNPDMAGHITAVAKQVAENGPTRAADLEGLARLIGLPPLTFRDHAWAS
ncbi:hypothetical protein ACWGE0_01725 [Lentzea sp. NPDC054927]